METSKQEWWSSADHQLHDLGGPSPYVMGPGRTFISGPDLPAGAIDGLDLGTWEARNVPALAPESGGTVVGVDVPEAAVAVAVAQTRFPSVTFHLAPACSLPIPSQSVRAALDWRRLHNLTEPGELSAALLENNRVLVVGGRLLVAVRGRLDVPNRNNRPQLVESDNGAGGRRRDLHFTLWSLVLAAGLTGFECLKWEEVTEDFLIQRVRQSATYLVAHCVKRRHLEPWEHPAINLVLNGHRR